MFRQQKLRSLTFDALANEMKWTLIHLIIYNYLYIILNYVIYFQKLNLELEENEGIIGDKPNFDQESDWKAKGQIAAGLFTLKSRPKAIW